MPSETFQQAWVFYSLILIVGIFLAGYVMKLVGPFMKVTGISILDYAPYFQNPTIDPSVADPSVISPGLALRGQYLLIPLMMITLLLNILAEELYFRAWLLPKMSKYRNTGWVAKRFSLCTLPYLSTLALSGDSSK